MLGSCTTTPPLDTKFAASMPVAALLTSRPMQAAKAISMAGRDGGSAACRGWRPPPRRDRVLWLDRSLAPCGPRTRRPRAVAGMIAGQGRGARPAAALRQRRAAAGQDRV